jgi:hypothetical protein
MKTKTRRQLRLDTEILKTLSDVAIRRAHGGESVRHVSDAHSCTLWTGCLETTM